MKITYNVDCMHNLAKLIIKFMRLSFPKVQSRISNCTIEWYLVARNINAREHTCVHILKYSKSTIVRVSSFLHFLFFVFFFFFSLFSWYYSVISGNVSYRDFPQCVRKILAHAAFWRHFLYKRKWRVSKVCLHKQFITYERNVHEGNFQ